MQINIHTHLYTHARRVGKITKENKKERKISQKLLVHQEFLLVNAEICQESIKKLKQWIKDWMNDWMNAGMNE